MYGTLPELLSMDCTADLMFVLIFEYLPSFSCIRKKTCLPVLLDLEWLSNGSLCPYLKEMLPLMLYYRPRSVLLLQFENLFCCSLYLYQCIY